MIQQHPATKRWQPPRGVWRLGYATRNQGRGSLAEELKYFDSEAALVAELRELAKREELYEDEVVVHSAHVLDLDSAEPDWRPLTVTARFEATVEGAPPPRTQGRSRR